MQIADDLSNLAKQVSRGRSSPTCFHYPPPQRHFFGSHGAKSEGLRNAS
jgi:hypothetical protein